MVSVSPNSCHTLSVKAASLICIMINATLFIEDRELGILTLHVLFKISLICIKLQKHICLICFFKRKISEHYVFLSSVTQMFSCAWVSGDFNNKVFSIRKIIWWFKNFISFNDYMYIMPKTGSLSTAFLISAIVQTWCCNGSYFSEIQLAAVIISHAVLWQPS